MKNSTLAGLMGGALALSIGTNGYLYYKNGQTIKNVEDRNVLRTYKDSIDIVFQNMEDSLENLTFLQEENSRLASAVEFLEARGPRIKTVVETRTIQVDPNERTEALIDEVKDLRSKLKVAGKPMEKVIASSPKEGLSATDMQTVAKYKALVESKDEEIAGLKMELEELQGERDKYAAEYASGIQSKYNNLLGENDDLKDRFSRGAIPQFGPVTVSGGVMDEGIFIPSYKSSKIERLRFNFSVLENPLITEPLIEQVTLRLLSEDGSVVSTKELNGAMTDIKDVYTLTEGIMVDGDMQGNSPQSLWFPTNGNLQDKLQKGMYTVELISRDKIRQVTEFEIN